MILLRAVRSGDVVSHDADGFAAGDIDILDVNIHLKEFVGRSCLAEED